MNCFRTKIFFVFFTVAFSAVRGFADVQETLAAANQLAEAGDFKQAATLLAFALQNSGTTFSELERKQIALQFDLLTRIKKDYSLTETELYDAIDKSLTGLTREEFARWLKEERFDSRTFNGVRSFVGTSVSNLYFRHPELNTRRRVPVNDAPKQKAMLENCRAIKSAAVREDKPYVLPHRYKAGITVTVESNAVPASEIIRAWLPIPRRYPYQKEFKLLSTSSRQKYLSDEKSPIRSIYLEQAARLDKPTAFQVSFEYTIHCVAFPLQSSKVTPANPEDPTLKPFLAEAPHVVFSDRIKELAAQISGEEKNPMLQAQLFYNWIADHIKYSYSREYSTLTNISDYCASNGYGDCGQEALLFITLCRSQGIPARWQSGWHLVPGSMTIHDWTEIYLAPYGWVPVDPWAGIYAMRYCTSLKSEERREIRDFYFGGLDQYRMIANSDHNQPLQPPKNGFRSDDVDFQRGELESGDENIYFDKYSYKLNAELLNAPASRTR
ncbi:MAG: transglutaminase-like domain-containing protein [Verrucomicrobiota bacterium]